ncbi:hypothetical protein JVT61DRAFT_10098 [Boletus reticuloceps]|uniref:Heterokaryon incompatibility domain-containing protein n=1 Tax=Boletus reticuloceps TaxID=495285 RepID=A0A8I3ADM7_9AGAM|nr:hypothetical protein JVT61DRAFT_10098 [Boletus reticuloceps]
MTHNYKLQTLREREFSRIRETNESLRAQQENSNNKIVDLEKTIQDLRNELAKSKSVANQHTDSLSETIRLLRADINAQETSSTKFIQELRDQLTTSQRVADQEGNSLNATINSLRSDLCIRDKSSDTKIKRLEQVTQELRVQLSDSQNNADSLIRTIRAHEQKHQCESLYAQGCIYDTAKCLLEVTENVSKDLGANQLITNWLAEFTHRFVTMLERVGDEALNTGKHDEALAAYSTILSLIPSNTVLIKWATTGLILGSANEALSAAVRFKLPEFTIYQAICDILERSDCRIAEAIECFRYIQNKLQCDMSTHGERAQWELEHVLISSIMAELHHQFTDPTLAIRKEIERTIYLMPRVLIDTTTGRLHDKIHQAAAFEGLLIYDELRSSMTTKLDHARIQREVKKFYRYVMLSHKWQPSEPTFQTVENISIYGLPESPTNDKLQHFCELVHSLHFQWAWNDTCCVNQFDKGVQQESLVAMFRWYRGSSLTVVHLLGVSSESQQPGDMWKNWKPYLRLSTFNHKEPAMIRSEMEQAMNFAAQELATLRPGLDRVREKLYLASKRQATREEDIAYSLFGIFNVAIPVIYGEGNQAVGRLLEYILTRSDNVTLLAWTGSSGSHNSYLPSSLTVYDQVVPPHTPPPIKTAEMNNMAASLRSSLPDSDFSLAVTLYELLYDLPPLSLVAGRLRLPGIVFPLTSFVPLLTPDSESNTRVYRATTPMLGNVDIKTTDDSFGTDGLLLIHPWISPLLDHDFSHGVAQCDLSTRALRLVIRLQQQFGALLLAPLARVQYRRVATDSLIMVRVREEVSLGELMDGVRTVDIQ